MLLLDPARADLARLPDASMPGDIDTVEWSPDGTRILASVRDGNETVLYVLPVDGSERLRIAGGASPAWDRGWSPDGRSIVFSRKGSGPAGVTPSQPPDMRSSEIVVAAADGSGARVVAAGSRPTWSPDGRRLAFFRTGPSGSDSLWAIDLGTGSELRLAEGFATPGQGVVGDPAIWSPDGGSVFSIGNGSACALCLVDALGGGARPVAVDGIAAAVPAGAADIEIVGWVDDRTMLMAVQGPSSALIRLGLDGRVATILKVDGAIRDVALAPDGRAIAFARVDLATLTSSIWSVDADGSGLLQLTRPLSRAGDDRPEWQPAPVAVAWPAVALPEATPEPSMVAGTVDLTLTGATEATVSLPASCGPRPDGVFGVEAEAEGYTVQLGLGADGTEHARLGGLRWLPRLHRQGI